MIFTWNTSKWGWGIGLIVVAALILASQLGGFVDLGVWSIIVAALVVVLLVQSLFSFNFGMVPLAIAALYWIFQTPLGLPEIGFWPLASVAVLVSIGVTALLPKKHWRKKRWSSGRSGTRIRYDKHGNRIDYYNDADDADDADYVVENDDDESDGINFNVRPRKRVSQGGSDNNPSISVQFGSVTRYLHADALETVDLNCSMGNLEVYFDNVTLSPDGAEMEVNCSLGNIEVYLPREWRVIDNLGASLGNAEVDDRFNDEDDAPTIRISGSASLGNIEVNRIKRKG